MRCATARKRLSDELDGTLSSRRKFRLAAHLGSCASCRSYREGLEHIQAGAALPDVRPPEFWASFESALDRKLAAVEAGRAAVARPFAVRRRWAWVAAATMALAGAALWVAFLRPGTVVAEGWVPYYEEVLDPLVRAVEANPEVAALVEREVRASIDELAPAPDPDAVVLSAADPLFWEDLSDDELRGIIAELENEIGRGGPQ